MTMFRYLSTSPVKCGKTTVVESISVTVVMPAHESVDKCANDEKDSQHPLLQRLLPLDGGGYRWG